MDRGDDNRGHHIIILRVCVPPHEIGATAETDNEFAKEPMQSSRMKVAVEILVNIRAISSSLVRSFT